MCEDIIFSHEIISVVTPTVENVNAFKLCLDLFWSDLPGCMHSLRAVFNQQTSLTTTNIHMYKPNKETSALYFVFYWF